MIIKAATTYSRKFLMVLTSDHVTGYTGAANTITVTLSKGPGAAGTTAAGVVTILDSVNLPGVYQVALTQVDTAVAGDLWFHCTAGTCDATDFCDQVQGQVFTDLSINASGQALIASSIKQNAALNGFTFVMTDSTTHAPKTGLIVTAQRSLGGAGFGLCANSVSELSNGVYSINLAATDTNSPTVMLRFTAANADDQDILLITQP